MFGTGEDRLRQALGLSSLPQALSILIGLVGGLSADLLSFLDLYALTVYIITGILLAELVLLGFVISTL